MVHHMTLYYCTNLVDVSTIKRRCCLAVKREETKEQNNPNRLCKILLYVEHLLVSYFTAFFIEFCLPSSQQAKKKHCAMPFPRVQQDSNHKV